MASGDWIFKEMEMEIDSRRLQGPEEDEGEGESDIKGI